MSDYMDQTSSSATLPSDNSAVSDEDIKTLARRESDLLEQVASLASTSTGKGHGDQEEPPETLAQRLSDVTNGKTEANTEQMEEYLRDLKKRVHAAGIEAGLSREEIDELFARGDSDIKKLLNPLADTRKNQARGFVVPHDEPEPSK